MSRHERDEEQLKLGVRSCCGQPVLVLSGQALVVRDEQWLGCEREGAGGIGGSCILQPLHPIHKKRTWQHSCWYHRNGYSLVRHPSANIHCKGKAAGQGPAAVHQGRFLVFSLCFWRVEAAKCLVCAMVLQLSPGWVSHIELYVRRVRVTSGDIQAGAMNIHSVYPALGDSQCNQETWKSGRTS